jgi:hypothetical protein
MLEERITALEVAANLPMTITNNNNINNFNNIIINNFCSENLSYIEPTLIRDCLKDMSFVPLFEQIYFHPLHPENHVLRLKNKREKLLEYFNDGHWKVENRDSVLNDAIYFNGTRLLVDYYKNNTEIVYDELKEIYDSYRACRENQSIDKWTKKIENMDKDLYQNIRKNLMFLLLSDKLRRTK